MHVSPSIILTLWNIWNKIKLFWPRIRNLYRPNIFVDFSSKRIKFINKEDEKTYHIPYFCLSIKNSTDKIFRLNSEKIKINNSFYHHIIFNIIKDYEWWNLWSCVNNDILIFYRENIDKLQNKFIILEPGEEKIFPMHLPIKSYRIISDIKHNSLTFFGENKSIVEIEINGKTYEYSSNFRPACEKFMAYLAFDFEIAESKRKIKGKTTSLIENS